VNQGNEITSLEVNLISQFVIDEELTKKSLKVIRGLHTLLHNLSSLLPINKKKVFTDYQIPCIRRGLILPAKLAGIIFLFYLQMKG